MKPKNLLILMSDEHNPKVMGCAGHPLIETPNLDALARSGTRFTSAYTTCPICVPARAAFADNEKDFDIVREAAKQPHNDPLVTVAIRSDGSVESVTIVQSSGVAALDEAIRRAVDSQKPYQAFPPGLASEYDVIEIRRTWYFDTAIRLY